MITHLLIDRDGAKAACGATISKRMGATHEPNDADCDACLDAYLIVCDADAPQAVYLLWDTEHDVVIGLYTSLARAEDAAKIAGVPCLIDPDPVLIDAAPDRWDDIDDGTGNADVPTEQGS